MANADIVFRKSSYCDGGACVEVAYLPGGEVALRDAKNVRQPGHVFGRAAWAVFTAAVRNDELDG